MYEGRSAADAALYEGQVAKKQARARALHTVLSGGSQVAFMGYKPSYNPETGFTGRDIHNR